MSTTTRTRRLTSNAPVIYKPSISNVRSLNQSAQGGFNNGGWHVVQCIPNQQSRAAHAIKAAGFFVYAPLIAIYRQTVFPGTRTRTRAWVVEPMLGAYIFAQFEPHEPWGKISRLRDGVGCEGVIRLLMDREGRPLPTRGLRVQELIAEQDARLKPAESRAEPLTAGAVVRVRRGPFEGRDGTVMSCDGYRTHVGLGIFGRTVETWVDRVDLVGV